MKIFLVFKIKSFQETSNAVLVINENCDLHNFNCIYNYIFIDT